MKLSLKQKLLLFLNGRCFLRYEKREGWHGYLPVYGVKCKLHGFFMDYPHGWTGYFWCPVCLAEWVNKA
jgi:hypothetical protein